MKAFFEEYGFVVITLIVVILLIAIATLFGNSSNGLITGHLTNWMNKLANKVDSANWTNAS